MDHARIYYKTEQYHDALILCDIMLAENQPRASFYLQQGVCFLALGQTNNAIAAYTQAIALNQNLTAAEYNIGYAHKIAGNFTDAIPIFQKLIAQNPDYEPARLALGFTYLSAGDFYHGWPAHEWYLKKYHKNGDALRALLASNSVAGKTVILVPEGGLGDTIQFIRYAERLKKLGATVIAHVQPPLIQLLSRCPFIDHVVSAKDPIAEHDAIATFMTLPAIFYDDEMSFCCTIPYIFPDQALVQYWHTNVSNKNAFKIGICWQASLANDESRLPIGRRGIPLELFAYVASDKNIALYSLQKYDGTEQGNTVPFPLITFPDSFDQTNGAFMDTAAVMMHLDLIITVDTAIAHLAGALGRPVWLLLPYYADWRWIYGRTDSPWYPTMRIFQQPRPFDWETVMHEVQKAMPNNRMIKQNAG